MKRALLALFLALSSSCPTTPQEGDPCPRVAPSHALACLCDKPTCNPGDTGVLRVVELVADGGSR